VHSMREPGDAELGYDDTAPCAYCHGTGLVRPELNTEYVVATDCEHCGGTGVATPLVTIVPAATLDDAGHRKPPCKLVDTDGNVFSIIGAVHRALKRDGQPERAAEWFAAATSAGSYDQVLQLLHNYVEAY
jgi:hypothetical protein